MTYTVSATRYERMSYRACGRSGLRLPLLSLGLWHNFGDTTPISRQRDLLRTAFDLGITHFDLANNYGPPYGSAETNFDRLLREDFRPYRDELVISTKAGTVLRSSSGATRSMTPSRRARRAQPAWAAAKTRKTTITSAADRGGERNPVARSVSDSGTGATVSPLVAIIEMPRK